MADDLRPTVRVDVLGPLRLVVDGAPVEVRGPKRRALLALLAVADGRSLTADYLVDALWPLVSPESGRAALYSHISRLRGHLGSAAGRLATLEGAYRLVLTADESDVGLARGLLAEGRASAGRDPEAACAPLREALALWRGPAFADLAEVAPLTAAVAGFEQLRREATDLLIQCAVDAGKANDVIGLAAAALDADPLREPAVLLLMRALAATGQAPQALHTGRAFRQRLAEETGLDPSSELAAVERGIAQGTIGPVHTGPSPQPTPTLARPSGRLIGRDAQLTAVHRLLTTERLVTIVGAGGVGKTRVALEVARRADTATVLLLAPVTDPAGVPHALAAALGLREVRGNVLAACAAFLGARPHLLVVDNCEHLLGAAADLVVALLNGCPGLTLLATSREPLGCPSSAPSAWRRCRCRARSRCDSRIRGG